jgi:hypothetical protein
MSCPADIPALCQLYALTMLDKKSVMCAMLAIGHRTGNGRRLVSLPFHKLSFIYMASVFSGPTNIGATEAGPVTHL